VERSLISIVSMIGALVGGVVVGLMSDRIGRRRAMILALLGAILMTPLWAYAPRAGLLVCGAFLIQFCVQGAWGVIPAHLSELSPNQVRGLLPGFAYQCGVFLASGVDRVEAGFAEGMSYAAAMALTAVVVISATAVIAALGRENRGVDFTRT